MISVQVCAYPALMLEVLDQVHLHKTAVQAFAHVSNENVTITSCMQLQIRPKPDDSTETLRVCKIRTLYILVPRGRKAAHPRAFLARMLGFRPVAVRDAEHTTRHEKDRKQSAQTPYSKNHNKCQE